MTIFACLDQCIYMTNGYILKVGRRGGVKETESICQYEIIYCGLREQERMSPLYDHKS